MAWMCRCVHISDGPMYICTQQWMAHELETLSNKLSAFKRLSESLCTDISMQSTLMGHMIDLVVEHPFIPASILSSTGIGLLFNKGFKNAKTRGLTHAARNVAQLWRRAFLQSKSQPTRVQERADQVPANISSSHHHHQRQQQPPPPPSINDLDIISELVAEICRLNNLEHTQANVSRWWLVVKPSLPFYDSKRSALESFGIDLSFPFVAARPADHAAAFTTPILLLIALRVVFATYTEWRSVLSSGHQHSYRSCVVALSDENERAVESFVSQSLVCHLERPQAQACIIEWYSRGSFRGCRATFQAGLMISDRPFDVTSSYHPLRPFFRTRSSNE